MNRLLTVELINTPVNLINKEMIDAKWRIKKIETFGSNTKLLFTWYRFLIDLIKLLFIIPNNYIKEFSAKFNVMKMQVDR